MNHDEYTCSWKIWWIWMFGTGLWPAASISTVWTVTVWWRSRLCYRLLGENLHTSEIDSPDQELAYAPSVFLPCVCALSAEKFWAKAVVIVGGGDIYCLPIFKLGDGPAETKVASDELCSRSTAKPGSDVSEVRWHLRDLYRAKQEPTSFFHKAMSRPWRPNARVWLARVLFQASCQRAARPSRRHFCGVLCWHSVRSFF